MFDDRDIFRVLLRYEGLPVTVQTYGLGRVFGLLTRVHVDCIRMTNTVPMNEADDSRWMGEIERANWEDSPQGRPETVIPIHHLISVTCEDDDFELNASSINDEPESFEVSSGVKKLTSTASTSTDDDVLPEPVETIDRIQVNIGARLIPFAHNDTKTKSLTARIKSLRGDLASTLGFNIPPVRLRSDLDLSPDEYCILINGAVVGRSDLRTDRHLAILPEHAAVRGLEGEETKEPVFDLPAIWVDKEHRRTAESQGCTVVDSLSVLITHLGEVAKNLRHKILSHEAVHQMLQELRLKSFALVDENFPKRIPTFVLHRVLTELLAERIRINCFEAIVEALVWHYTSSKSFDDVYEAVRRVISGNVIRDVAGSQSVLNVVLLSREMFSSLEEATALEFSENIIEPLTSKAAHYTRIGQPFAVVAPGKDRRAVRQLLSSMNIPWIPVLSGEDLSDARELGISATSETVDADSKKESVT